MIGYVDKVIRLLVLVLPKMSGYCETFKGKDGDKDKNNKLMFVHIDDETLLENYKNHLYKYWRLEKYWIKCLTSLWYIYIYIYIYMYIYIYIYIYKPK